MQARKNLTLSWSCLLLAIVLEVAGTTSMKLSDGFSAFWPSVSLFICYGLSFVLLALTLKEIEVSTAYAIWSGAGTILVAFLGVHFFHEIMTPAKAVSLLLILLGVIGLKLET